MILRLAFKNYGSFREAAEVSFVATRIKDDDVHVPMPSPGSFAKHGVLPVLALYGANASGKSTVVGALRTLANLSHCHNSDRKPFMLDAASRRAPTQFELDFLVDGVRYEYGIIFTDRRVEEEWIYAWPRGRRQLWFHRKEVDGTDDKGDSLYFGPSIKGAFRKAAAQAYEAEPLLNIVDRHNGPQCGPQLKAVYEFVRRGIWFPKEFPDMLLPMMISVESPMIDPQRRGEVLRLLRAADLGVTDFRVRDGGFRIESIANNLEAVPCPVEQATTRQIELMHEGAGCWLSPEQESSGTVALVGLLNWMMFALDRGAPLVVDDIHRSLHPLLCSELIRMFSNPRSNPRGAQLLFTTHDVNLMEHLRRDEVHLVEKGNDGSSQIFPMSQFKLLRREDMRKMYLEGRVGGLPRTGCMSMLTSPRTS